MWDPACYLTYADQRTRPARDLLAAVDVADPAYVVDLGCGTGTSTAVLAARWPDAEVLGLDSSPEMVAEARAGGPPPNVRYEVGDAAAWRPARPVDVLFSNAALQWVPGHLDLLEGWLAGLAPGGRLAFQVPGNSDAPAHRLLRELCADPRWSRWVGGFAHPHLTACRAGEYVAFLARRGRHLDAWETTYVHLLQGGDPVLRWISGTGLRPVLAALDAVPAERAAFLAAYAAALREAYPAGEAGTVFPFRRVFVVVGSGAGRRQSATACGAEPPV